VVAVNNVRLLPQTHINDAHGAPTDTNASSTMTAKAKGARKAGPPVKGPQKKVTSSPPPVPQAVMYPNVEPQEKR
jgi:hypothetical protein